MKTLIPNPAYPLANYELRFFTKDGKPIFGLDLPHRFDKLPPEGQTVKEFDRWVRANSIPTHLPGKEP